MSRSSKQRACTWAAISDPGDPNDHDSHNAQRLDGIVHRAASEKNWPLDLAGCYLRNKLAFEMTPRRREGLELFFDKAVEHGLAARRRALEIAAV